MQTLEIINNRIRNCIHLEFAIYNYSKNTLVVVGSENLLYFHEFEIIFKEVFAISCNSAWRINTKEPFISIVDEISEVRRISKEYGVEIGNTIFKLASEDDLFFYIISKEVLFVENVVKYT